MIAKHAQYRLIDHTVASWSRDKERLTLLEVTELFARESPRQSEGVRVRVKIYAQAKPVILIISQVSINLVDLSTSQGCL